MSLPTDNNQIDINKIHTGSELFKIERVYALREIEYVELKKGWSNDFLFSCYLSGTIGYILSTIPLTIKNPENKKLYEHLEVKIIFGLLSFALIWFIIKSCNKSKCKVIKSIDSYFKESEVIKK